MARPPAVHRTLSPEAVVAAEGTFTVTAVEETETGTLVTAAGPGMSVPLRFESHDDGLRYTAEGEVGPFDHRRPGLPSCRRKTALGSRCGRPCRESATPLCRPHRRLEARQRNRASYRGTGGGCARRLNRPIPLLSGRVVDARETTAHNHGTSEPAASTTRRRHDGTRRTASHCPDASLAQTMGRRGRWCDDCGVRLEMSTDGEPVCPDCGEELRAERSAAVLRRKGVRITASSPCSAGNVQ